MMTLGQEDAFQQIIAKYHRPGGASSDGRWGGTGLPQADTAGADK